MQNKHDVLKFNFNLISLKICFKNLIKVKQESILKIIEMTNG
jgi:hypothetical protein